MYSKRRVSKRDFRDAKLCKSSSTTLILGYAKMFIYKTFFTTLATCTQRPYYNRTVVQFTVLYHMM